jgi:hypothetical protein
MSVEFLVPARWLTVSGTAVKTRTYKIDPGFPAVTILASPFIAPHLPAFKARITTWTWRAWRLLNKRKGTV